MQTLYFSTHREFRESICGSCPIKEMGLCSFEEPLACSVAKGACREIMRRKGCDVRVGNFLFAPQRELLASTKKGEDHNELNQIKENDN